MLQMRVIDGFFLLKLGHKIVRMKTKPSRINFIFSIISTFNEYCCNFLLKDENRYHEDIFGITLRTEEIHRQKREDARVKKMSSIAQPNTPTLSTVPESDSSNNLEQQCEGTTANTQSSFPFNNITTTSSMSCSSTSNFTQEHPAAVALD